MASLCVNYICVDCLLKNIDEVCVVMHMVGLDCAPTKLGKVGKAATPSICKPNIYNRQIDCSVRNGIAPTGMGK